MALDTKEFINRLVKENYTHLCVVPCSFAQYVINEAINNPNIEYVPSASEAVACSIAAGLKMSGKKPIVIVQSSGVTNMGSCITSFLKPYGVTFPILSSWRTYKDGDSEIQHQHLATELPKLIEAYGYENVILDNENLDNAIKQIELCDTTHTIGVIKKDSFTKVELDDIHKLDLSNYIPRSEFLINLNEKFKSTNTLFIGTTGNTAREMYSFMKVTNNFYMAGNMGGALSLGLGAAKGGKKVIVCGGDAEFVMHMGGLTTSGRYKDQIDLTYVLFDNESNKSTGGQNTYQSHTDYISIAKASGLDAIEQTIISLDDFSKTISELDNTKGLKFIHVKCGNDDETPRPPIEVVKVNKFQ
jgi:thiamine pyrophosphate-dependent acetolactate synthase large subunit-like protein